MGDRCPDRQLLSVYFDGELPSPWKEKVAGHVAGCPSCTERLAGFDRLRQSICAEPTDGEIMAAQDKVWQQLGLGARKGARVVRFGGLWQRRVSIPLPAAAAAALLLVALAVFFAMKTPSPAAMPVMASFESPGIIPVSDMEDVLQYLGSRDNSDVVIIRLPESRDFVSYGEPAIIKAADYNRRTPGVRRP
ncbi:MAG: hypothetical protein LBQ69_03790 [Treponema sp.]|jgi:hypothetical protein|nr:hypothetical protein [Treponema sp.]